MLVKGTQVYTLWHILNVTPHHPHPLTPPQPQGRPLFICVCIIAAQITCCNPQLIILSRLTPKPPSKPQLCLAWYIWYIKKEWGDSRCVHICLLLIFSRERFSTQLGNKIQEIFLLFTFFERDIHLVQQKGNVICRCMKAWMNINVSFYNRN